MLHDVDYVLAKLAWMRGQHIWPNGLRYLWTDAFGVVLLISLYRELGDETSLDQAERLVGDVERVLGRPRGLRIGEAPDRDGQYYYYLAMWLFALARLGDLKPEYRTRGIAIARDIHRVFVIPGRGVVWKMKEDLSAPYPGYGFGAMDAFDGYVSYRLLDEEALSPEIAEMETLIDLQYPSLHLDQDLGLGMMLWLAHFFPEEEWAKVQTRRSLEALDQLWVDPSAYFARGSHAAMCGSPSPITASRSGCSRSTSGPNESIGSTHSSNHTDQTTNMIARRSPMSWPAAHTYREHSSKPLGRKLWRVLILVGIAERSIARPKQGTSTEHLASS